MNIYGKFSKGAEYLIGTDQNDVIYPLGGSDQIDGKNGFDLVVVDNTGAKSVTAGTASATPVFPAIPANSAVCAAVYVPATDTAIQSNQIVDKRVIIGAFSNAQTLGRIFIGY